MTRPDGGTQADGGGAAVGGDAGVRGPEADVVPTVSAAGAWRSRRAWIVLLVSVVAAVGLDLLSKELAFRHVADGPVVVDRERVLEVKREDPRAINVVVPVHEPVTVVPRLLEFKLVLNPGAVFGVGPGKRWFFVGFTLVALGFGLWMFGAWTGPRNTIVHVAIGLVIGGGIGNLYDRLVHACVRDFIHPLPGVHWPFGASPMGSAEVWPYVSNLADLFLLVGIAAVVIHLWRRDARGRVPAGPPAA